MTTSRINLKRGSKVLAVLEFTYTDDIEDGELRISGKEAREVAALFKRPMGLYLPSEKGVDGGRKPNLKSWSWIHAAARYISMGDSEVFDGFQLRNPPLPRFFKAGDKDVPPDAVA